MTLDYRSGIVGRMSMALALCALAAASVAVYAAAGDQSGSGASEIDRLQHNMGLCGGLDDERGYPSPSAPPVPQFVGAAAK